MKNINKDMIKSIILQLLVILTELGKYDFYHDDPTLIFTKDPISYIYSGKHIEGSITVKISNLAKSSITFNNIRFFEKNAQTAVHMEKNTFVPEIPKMKQYYKLTNTNIDLYRSMRKIGIPIFSDSFNFYCFMLSLMSNKHFFDVVMNDITLYDLWKNMWLEENLSYVENLVAELHDISNIDNNMIFDTIKGLWLRSDIVNHMFNSIKK